LALPATSLAMPLALSFSSPIGSLLVGGAWRAVLSVQRMPAE
jgi:hypothetical protein